MADDPRPRGAAGTTAQLRSYEAELATELAAADPTPETNAHAAQLHGDAARWHRQADNERRALVHDAYARTHAQLRARLQAAEEEGDE